MFVRYIYSIYIYNIYTGITGRIFLFAIDSHLVGPVNIRRILEITPGHSVSDLYTQVIPIVSYSSQPDTLFLPPNNSKNYFQEGNIPLHSPIHYSLFLWIERPALNTFDSKILRERRRWEKRFASDGRKKKKNWPTEERISDRVGSRLFLFFSYFIRVSSVRLIKGEYRRGRIGVKLEAAEIDIIHLPAKVGKVSKGEKEGEERDGKWSDAARYDRSRSAHKEMSDWSRKRSSPLAFAVARARYIVWSPVLPSPIIFSPSKNGHGKIRRGRKKLDNIINNK